LAWAGPDWMDSIVLIVWNLILNWSSNLLERLYLNFLVNILSHKLQPKTKSESLELFLKGSKIAKKNWRRLQFLKIFRRKMWDRQKWFFYLFNFFQNFRSFKTRILWWKILLMQSEKQTLKFETFIFSLFLFSFYSS
jgi:hypothetical protein